MTTEQLKLFVQSTFSNQENFIVKRLMSEYRQRIGEMVKTLEISPTTIHHGLGIIAGEMLSHPYEIHHVYTFLVFCIELEKYCKVHHYTWFSHEKLIEIIADILQAAGYIPPTPTPGREDMLGGIKCAII